jgi:hypothetical protein
MNEPFWNYDSWLEINRERVNSWCETDAQRLAMYEREQQEFEGE